MKAGTWDLDSVREHADVVSESRTTGQKVHVGHLMTIVSVKFAEMGAEHHKLKSRVVFRGDSVKDEGGAAAVFQELSATPTNISDINSNLAFGLLPGNSTSQADAIQAYLQSTLNSQHPTWVCLPRELWPKSWGNKYLKPVVRLRRALYGHPEAGGHWELYLTKQILSMGGQKIEGHLSSFYIPKYGLYLTVYVDDLLLSGPSINHDPFWAELSKTVNIEPPAALERFIGRGHVLHQKDGKCIDFDMREFAQSVVDQYISVTGQTKLRKAATPFCPDGSLPADGDSERGELSSVACSLLMKQLWLARLARPDLQKPIADLATNVQTWSRNCDKRMYRLVCYINSTKGDLLRGKLLDRAEDLSLKLYVDADFCGSDDDTRSTNGGYLVLVGPKGTWFPITWVAKKQTSTSRSTTEAEMVSLAHSLFSEAIPASDLWRVLMKRPVHIHIMEDNQATIKIAVKGYSPKLRHCLRTHKVNVGSVKDVLDEGGVSIEYVESEQQAADIFTKALAAHKWDHATQLLGIIKDMQIAKENAEK